MNDASVIFGLILLVGLLWWFTRRTPSYGGSSSGSSVYGFGGEQSLPDALADICPKPAINASRQDLLNYCECLFAATATDRDIYVPSVAAQPVASVVPAAYPAYSTGYPAAYSTYPGGYAGAYPAAYSTVPTAYAGYAGYPYTTAVAASPVVTSTPYVTSAPVVASSPVVATAPVQVTTARYGSAYY